MLMKVAVNSSNQLVSIGQVERGLACQCFCFECGESVIAKKGEINEHHFAHTSNKESCDIRPESILHKYAKEVIMAEQQIYLPSLPNVENKGGQLWQFHTINPEQSVGNIRPDLIAINDDEMIFIEIAVTSFIDDEKRAFIDKLKVKTIEIDLSVFLKSDFEIPSDFVKNYILNHLDNKTWIYPKSRIVQPTIKDDNEKNELLPENQKKSFQILRFTINGYWVDAFLFESGMLSLKMVTFNRDLVDLFKKWGGSYNSKYKSWNYFKPYSDTILQRLNELNQIS